MDTTTLTREQLYEQVWNTPMRTLAPRYGFSDVGLAKICRKHGIPTPPLGYWAKREVGKAPPRPPLPPAADKDESSIVLHEGPQPTRPGKPPTPDPPYDPDLLEVLHRLTKLPQVSVGTQLRNLHPLVQVTKERLDRPTPDENNMAQPRCDGNQQPLNVYVSKNACAERSCSWTGS